MDHLVLSSPASPKLEAFGAESKDQASLLLPTIPLYSPVDYHAAEIHPVPFDCSLASHNELVEPKSLEGFDLLAESKVGEVCTAGHVDIASTEALATANLPLTAVKVGVEQLGTPIKLVQDQPGLPRVPIIGGSLLRNDSPASVLPTGERLVEGFGPDLPSTMN
ncbi:hypothetical protein Nepgr_027762 [Nepenthes gracilis]|uniref:Uncharacterized protein n=1 Tax=Nepenthes gracilis TaxID=150966 RepID=A0AAD3Y3F3_NEPGR|nr:hypothetical protein Nepgr_027762 [Nepenthes gracilis]